MQRLQIQAAAVRTLALAVTIAALAVGLPAQAQYTYGVRYVFGNSPQDGSTPQAGLVLGAGGILYGVTYTGGTADKGTVFSIDPSGNYTSVYSFGSSSIDGTYPIGGLIAGPSGVLYGATYSDNTSLLGFIYQVDPSGKESLLYQFTGLAYNPQGSLLQDSLGNLYGTTYQGGNGYGAVYVLDTSGKFTLLHGFNYVDGGRPTAGVVMDSSGNLFGTASVGNGQNGGGEVFKIDTAHHFSIFHAFQISDGSNPYGGLNIDANGNLYGMTKSGGAYGYGVVYKLDPSGNETVLYSFTGGIDGAYPLYATLYQDANGNLFGTTTAGGAHGLGTVFELDVSGKETVLHSFDYTDGDAPYGGVVADANGNLWGTTYTGGDNGYGWGVVYELTPGISLPYPTSVTLTPNPVSGGRHLSGTVTLDEPAPAGGTKVSLQSSDATSLKIPTTVTVPAGATTAMFKAKSSAVQSDTAVTVTASTSAGAASTSIIVAAASLSSVTVAPNVIHGGNSGLGTVTLTAPAPAGGATVSLTVSNPVAQIPATVTVPEGSTSMTFAVATSTVTSKQKVTLTANWGGSKKQSHFSVVP